MAKKAIKFFRLEVSAPRLGRKRAKDAGTYMGRHNQWCRYVQIPVKTRHFEGVHTGVRDCARPCAHTCAGSCTVHSSKELHFHRVHTDVHYCAHRCAPCEKAAFCCCAHLWPQMCHLWPHCGHKSKIPLCSWGLQHCYIHPAFTTAFEK